ncbi:MAG TPA: hypothetical protein VGF99_04495, partial [Myxococcota bacterium]
DMVWLVVDDGDDDDDGDGPVRNEGAVIDDGDVIDDGGGGADAGGSDVDVDVGGAGGDDDRGRADVVGRSAGATGSADGTVKDGSVGSSKSSCSGPLPATDPKLARSIASRTTWRRQRLVRP